MVEIKSYRDAMARLGAAVNVITTDGPAGRGGFTATAVTSVTDQPPTLLVCMNRSSDQNEIFKANTAIAINVLSSEQSEISAVFAGATKVPSIQRFETGSWGKLETGAPILEGATAVFDCHIVQTAEVGTHTVFFCEVQSVQLHNDITGLVYFARGYHAMKPLVL